MTKNEKCKLLNERLSNQTKIAAVNQFSYLDNWKVKTSTIIKHWENKTLGNLLYQFDKPRFNLFLKNLEA